LKKEANKTERGRILLRKMRIARRLRIGSRRIKTSLLKGNLRTRQTTTPLNTKKQSCKKKEKTKRRTGMTVKSVTEEESW